MERSEFLKKIEKNIEEKSSSKSRNYKDKTKLIEHNWKFMTEYAAKDMDLAKKLFESNETANAVQQALYTVTEIFENITGIDTNWLVDEIDRNYQRKLNNEDKSNLLGGCVNDLVYWGSSKNQAMEAVSEWLIISKTKIRDAYYDYKKKKNIFKTNYPSDYSHLILLEYMLTGEATERAFPRHHKKAYEAFINAGICYFSNRHMPNNTFLKSNPSAEHIYGYMNHIHHNSLKSFLKIICQNEDEFTDFIKKITRQKNIA